MLSLYSREWRPKTYYILLSKSAAQHHWEVDLNWNVNEQMWDRINIFNHDFSFHAGLSENRYKLTHHWYLTHRRLSRMYSGIKDVCWKCGSNNEMYMDMWWECIYVRTFWKLVQDQIMLMFSISLTMSS